MFLPVMSNVLAEEKRQQVLALGRLVWSLRRIEAATGVRRETASHYLKAAGLTVRGRGRPPARPAKPAISSEVSTDSSPASAAGTGTGDEASGSGDRPSRAPRASVCAPGEEAQADYGDGPMVRDAASGKDRRTRLFVLTLGYSRKAVRLLVHRSSAQVWAELHERAFRRLGGSVRVVVLDNLKEGVLTPDIYDPTLNPLYRDVLAHYGVVALPCRVGDPDRKFRASYYAPSRTCDASFG